MKLSDDDMKWVEKTLNGLSVREKIGQLLVPCLTEHTAAPLSVPKMVDAYCVGGGHSFGKTLADQRRTIREVQDAAKVPLLISGDLERGAGDRLPECTQFASQLALGFMPEFLLAAVRLAF